MKRKFNETLRSIMDEKKISGREIAEKITEITGKKIDERTIRSYASGQTTPKNEMKKNIMKAISLLCDIPEKSLLLLLEEKSDEQDGDRSREFSKYAQEISEKFVLMSSVLLFSQNEWEAEREKLTLSEAIDYETNQMMQAISKLSPTGKKYLWDYFDNFILVDFYEMTIWRQFKQLSKEDREDILKHLECEHLDAALCQNDKFIYASSKIAIYTQMMQCCRERPNALEMCLVIKDSSEGDDDIDKAFKEKLYDIAEKDPELNGLYDVYSNLMYLLSMDSEDWYFLSLLQRLRISDSGVNIANTYSREILGDKLITLLFYIQKKLMK